MMIVSSITSMDKLNISSVTPVVQVRFAVPASVQADEGSEVRGRLVVEFIPQTEIPFTVMVETFDLSPPDAEGLLSNINGCVELFINIKTLAAGVDYQPLIANVTLSQFQTTGNLVVIIIQDNITERTEAFEARIIIPTEAQQLGVSLGSPSIFSIEIFDDDRKLLFM